LDVEDFEVGAVLRDAFEVGVRQERASVVKFREINARCEKDLEACDVQFDATVSEVD
jgi:hypothetical protein